MIIIILLIILSIGLVIRSEKVHKERFRVINFIGDYNIKMIEEYSPNRLSWSIIDRHSYDEMVFKFWIPVKSFYADIK